MYARKEPSPDSRPVAQAPKRYCATCSSARFRGEFCNSPGSFRRQAKGVESSDREKVVPARVSEEKKEERRLPEREVEFRRVEHVMTNPPSAADTQMAQARAKGPVESNRTDR